MTPQQDRNWALGITLACTLAFMGALFATLNSSSGSTSESNLSASK